MTNEVKLIADANTNDVRLDVDIDQQTTPMVPFVCMALVWFYNRLQEEEFRLWVEQQIRDGGFNPVKIN